MNDITDTICALSTPPGHSGIAVVRVSGGRALSILKKIFQAKTVSKAGAPRMAVLGKFIYPLDGSEIDEGIATCFSAPHSYTGEDMCELSIHGSPVLASALLDCLCDAGARLAGPGEFTMRAFLNGKIDLAQAEAIRDIIESSTHYQAQVAAQQRSGSLGLKLRPIKELLIDVIVQLESTIEFAEEDLAIESRDRIAERLDEIREALSEWVLSFRKGRVIREGFSLAIVGGPNVGKSSLFNALLERHRSIVTDIPGTTRDLVSESMNIGGIPVRLQDTAGIHDAGDFVENLGMDQSRQAMADSDAILLVGDRSRIIDQRDVEFARQLAGMRCISVINKSDLESLWSDGDKKSFAVNSQWIEVSARTKIGIDRLREMILDEIIGPDSGARDGVLITSLRHCRVLEGAAQEIRLGGQALREGLSEEFALTNLLKSLQLLGEITGETRVEDLLEEIFSRFCIGK